MKIKLLRPFIQLAIWMALFLFTTAAPAQTLNEPLARTEALMNLYMQDGFDVFVDSVFSGSTWVESRSLDKLKLEADSYLNNKAAGKSYGFDLVSTAHIGDRMMSITYPLRTDRMPVAFHFMWYRPDDSWRINSFQFDTDLDDALREVEKWKMDSWISEN